MSGLPLPGTSSGGGGGGIRSSVSGAVVSSMDLAARYSHVQSYVSMHLRVLVLVGACKCVVLRTRTVLVCVLARLCLPRTSSGGAVSSSSDWADRSRERRLQLFQATNEYNPYRLPFRFSCACNVSAVFCMGNRAAEGDVTASFHHESPLKTS